MRHGRQCFGGSSTIHGVISLLKFVTPGAGMYLRAVRTRDPIFSLLFSTRDHETPIAELRVPIRLGSSAFLGRTFSFA